MSKKKSITILIAIIGLLLIVLAGAFGYIIGTSNSFSDKTLSNSSTILNDNKIKKELQELKAMYDSKIAEKTNNYNDLQIEKDKVQSLVYELEKTKNDANALLKYKTQYQSLESKMKVLINEIIVLKHKKTNVVSIQENSKIEKALPKIKADNIVTIPKKEGAIPKIELNSTKPINNISKQEVILKSDDFFGKKELPKNNNSETEVKPIQDIKKAPINNIEKFTKVILSNIHAEAYYVKSNAKQVETDISNKTDLIKISFTLDKSATAKSGEKNYYIQIIDGKNNVLGKRITEFFDSESLIYSLSRFINYDNTISSNCTIEFRNDNFAKGVYFINIFDRNDLVGKTSFTLK